MHDSDNLTHAIKYRTTAHPVLEETVRIAKSAFLTGRSNFKQFSIKQIEAEAVF